MRSQSKRAKTQIQVREDGTIFRPRWYLDSDPNQDPPCERLVMALDVSKAGSVNVHYMTAEEMVELGRLLVRVGGLVVQTNKLGGVR